MKKISAHTLEAALLEASRYFNCSLTQIDYEILQHPSGGIFGLWKKEAIIVATKKQEGANEQTHQTSPNQAAQATPQYSNESAPLSEAAAAPHSMPTTQETMPTEARNQDMSESINVPNAPSAPSNQAPTHQKIQTPKYTQAKYESHVPSTQQKRDSQSYERGAKQAYSNKNTNRVENEERATHTRQSAPTQNTYTSSAHTAKYESTPAKQHTKDFGQDFGYRQDSSLNDEHDYKKRATYQGSKAHNDFDVMFYDKETTSSTTTWQHETKDIETICQEVQEGLTELLQFLPLELNKIQVKPYDEHTLFILVDGLDAALLIGQKGYRYKSLSYLLFNWIHTCYGYGVRLEIAQFLKNQEEMMRSYLEPIIESAKIHGKAQTKPLDGILTHIALKMLRDALPNKYIVFRETAEGEKYITISEFLHNPRNSVHGFGSLPKY